VVSVWDPSAWVGWRLGGAAAAAALVGLELYAPGAPGWALLILQAAALAAAHALACRSAVRRMLLPAGLVESQVQQRARRCFREQGLTRTRGRTGILIFVALLERRVVVLADEGIHRALDPDERWQQVVDLVLAGLRAGQGIEGLEAGVRRCGEILARHVPIVPDRDLDELPNAIVVED
jgi:putative membrane protein